jgi:AraC family transcriptional regulator
VQSEAAKQMKRISFKSSASWLQVLPKNWTKASVPLHEERLIVEHSLQPSSEIESCSGIEDHILVFTFNSNIRQVNHFDGREHNLANTGGDFFLIPANVPCYVYWETEVADEALSFHVDSKLLQKVAVENDCLQSNRIELRPILQARDPQIEAIATLFRTEMYNDQLGSKLYSESLANLFLLHLLRHYCTQPLTIRSYEGGFSTHTLQQVVDYIQANLDRKLTLEAIAQHFNLSVRYFCELFTQSMGMPPYQYVLQQRVERAKQLLKNKDRAIVDIALECGFANQTHLNRHFRKITGITPKTYRSQ